MEYRFPEGFFWGSATAAYQVEGGIENNDWAEAAKQGKVPAAGKATDHYNRYEEDFDIVKKLNQNAHRFSIEWARIEPEEGRFNEKEIGHYRKVISALRERGIEPFVTLWHFTLPLWFSRLGGFENKKSPFYFSRYCEHVVKNLGDQVKFWITINEPMVYFWESYIKKDWPPFKRNIFLFRKIMKNLIYSHIEAYKKIKEVDSDSQIGIAKNNADFDTPGIIFKSHRRLFWNHYFLKKIFKHQDFIGLNYYFHKHFGYRFYEEKSALGWPIYPKGIYHVLLELKKYNKSVYITENGLADAKDEKRENFIKEHLKWVHQAIQEGIDIRGYFYWSLLDTFEWEKGFEPRFGLVEVNYQTMERKIRPSAYEYGKICKENKLEI